MLKKIRVGLATLFFVAITVLFLDFTGTVHHYLGWMAKLQFLPAVLALNFVVIALLVLLTLLFGRIYCSVICPLGVYQDGVANLSVKAKKRRKNNRPYHFKKEMKWLRYGVWALFVLAIVFGLNSLVALVAPYSAWGRIVQNVLQPVYIWGNNLLAGISERAESYTFYSKEVWLRSLPTFIVAVLTLGVVTLLAWRGGRDYCNSFCPVGTTLSFLSRFAAFRPVIDAGKCRNCHVCENKCKASCIDISNHRIDYSRCVDCFNCIDNCRFDALKYRFAYGNKKTAPATDAEPSDSGRRAFMIGAVAATTAATVSAQEKKVDGGLAEVLDKKMPQRRTRITPPGSKGKRNMYSHCTACQLCVAVCPNNVLRPSTDPGRFMQPESSYERGYCRPECTKCSEVCPAGAIRKISVEEKTSVQIGHAVWVKENCVVLTDDVNCGNCARHCPSGAILMILSDPSDPSSRKIPAVHEEKCIGCGACEHLCPARPFSAIYVEGHEEHRIV